MNIAFSRTSRPSLPHSALSRAWSTIGRWWRWRQERQELLTMTQRELRDIGLSRTDARRIAGQPMWRW